LGLKIEIRKNRMVISLPGDVLFASGSDELEDKGGEILAKVAAVVREDAELAKRTYQVAGHTDDEKLTSARTRSQFKDNWGLSLMRARTVLIYLINPLNDEKDPGGGLDDKLWSASGYGDTDPVASNAGKFGRQKNRRVELIMMPNVEEMLDLKSLAAEPTDVNQVEEPSAEDEEGGAEKAPAAKEPAKAPAAKEPAMK
jgi:chemotaxis protein MotB